MSMMFQPTVVKTGQLGFEWNNSSNNNSNNSSNDPPWWWNDSVSLISQGMNTWGGRNTGTQIISTSDGRIREITQPQPVQQQYPAYPPAGYAPAGVIGQSSVGGGVGSGIDGALSWVTENPLLVGGIVLGAILLFKDPPKRR